MISKKIFNQDQKAGFMISALPAAMVITSFFKAESHIQIIILLGFWLAIINIILLLSKD